MKVFHYAKKFFLPCKENSYYPIVLTDKFLFWLIIIIFSLKLIIIPFYFYFPNSVFFASITKSSLIDLTNKARLSAGLAVVVENPILDKAAFLKAQDMINNNYFSHYSPQGLSPWHWFSIAGYNYEYAGENLAIGFLDSQDVYQAWMNSYSHKQNILNPNYKEIGIAVVSGKLGDNKVNIVVQLFGSQKSNINFAKNIEKNVSIYSKESQKEVNPLSQGEVSNQGVLKEQENNQNISSLPQEETLVAGTEIVGKEYIGSFSSKQSFLKKIFSFFSNEYEAFLDKLIYSILLFISAILLIALLVDVFWYRPFSLQHRDILLKTFVFALILFGFTFLDKESLLKIISSKVIIN
jgi:hypothetical protein